MSNDPNWKFISKYCVCLTQCKNWNVISGFTRFNVQFMGFIFLFDIKISHLKTNWFKSKYLVIIAVAALKCNWWTEIAFFDINFCYRKHLKCYSLLHLLSKEIAFWWLVLLKWFHSKIQNINCLVNSKL